MNHRNGFDHDKTRWVLPAAIQILLLLVLFAAEGLPPMGEVALAQVGSIAQPSYAPPSYAPLLEGVWDQPAYAPQQADSIRISVDGEIMESVDSPFIENGRVMIPLRSVVEYLGGRVSWYPDGQQIIGFRGARGFDLTIGAPRATLSDGRSYALDVPAMLVRGRTYIPLRFASEAMGCEAEWLDELRMVSITTIPMDIQKEVEALAMPVLLRISTDKGTGSGFFFSKDGQIITLADVVRNADWITVEMSSGEKYQAELLRIDSVLNLAKLRISRAPGEDFPVFRYFDDFPGMSEGESVFAFGSPLFAQTPLSQGVILAKVSGEGQPMAYDTYRITADITRENRGGPLVKESGAVIGILCHSGEDPEAEHYAIPIEYVFQMQQRD